MKKVVVIGAGFSGMSAAYFLNRVGFQVEVFEKENEPGGLIRTVRTQWGACETAANGILNSKIFENLANEVGINLLPTQRLSRNRYIFRSKIRRWPLSFIETAVMVFKLIFSRKTPRKEESIQNWGRRVLGVQATTYLLGPVLQGIYAGDISKMSASLILSRFFKKGKRQRPKIRGLVCPEGGMGEFFSKTETYLKSRGVKFHYGGRATVEKEKEDTVYVITASSTDTAEILKVRNLELAQEFQGIETLSMVKITAFFKNGFRKIKGFGVLFPRDQKVGALGILFNNFIFKSGATRNLSESYIYGGAFGGAVVNEEEQAILKFVLEDRARLYGGEAKPDMEGFYLRRWPSTLPHYTVELEQKLRRISPDITQLEKEGIFILGNFLGGIGLSQLLEGAFTLPGRIQNLHG